MKREKWPLIPRANVSISLQPSQISLFLVLHYTTLKSPQLCDRSKLVIKLTIIGEPELNSPMDNASISCSSGLHGTSQDETTQGSRAELDLLSKHSEPPSVS